MAIRINRRRARRIFDRLIKAYREKAYPFSLPEAIPPQVGNVPLRFPSRRQRALFLFHACYYMRGTIRSDDAMRSLTSLYVRRPKLFLPEHARLLNPAKLARILRRNGLGYLSNQIAGGWIRNAKVLHRSWRGNPFNLLEGVTSYEQACERIQNKHHRGFFGFQEKMVSMLIYFYVDAELIDSFRFPPPVDFHALRIMFAHEITVPDTYDGPVYHKSWLADLRRLLMDYCHDQRVSPNEFCEATWILSRILCEQHPGNRVWVDGPRDGRRTPLRLNEYSWGDVERQRYAAACQRCPIETTCQRLVPSTFYYISGDIHAVRRRDKPPEQEVPF